jgi:hypothetical protein
MDINNEDFTPELKVWALEHFNQMAAKAVWRPDGTGCRYRKVDDTTLRLEHRVDHPDSIHHHDRIAKLFAIVNIDMIDDDVMVTSPAITAEDAFRQEMQERQAVAASWTTEDGTRLADLPLEDAKPTYMGDREILLDNGETSTIEDWGVKAYYGDDKELIMNPDDYNLLAGDDLFMRYWTGSYFMVALTRQQMFEMADAGELGVLVGSTCPETGVKVPPWMWGTYCREQIGEEE